MAAFVFRISSEYNLSSLKTFNGRINILKRHNLLESFELAQVKRDLIQSINCFTSCHTTYDLTKLGNIRKISKFGGDILVTSLSSRNKTFAIAVKNDAEADIEVFYSYSILLDFFTLSH